MVGARFRPQPACRALSEAVTQGLLDSETCLTTKANWSTKADAQMTPI